MRLQLASDPETSPLRRQEFCQSASVVRYELLMTGPVSNPLSCLLDTIGRC